MEFKYVASQVLHNVDDLAKLINKDKEEGSKLELMKIFGWSLFEVGRGRESNLKHPLVIIIMIRNTGGVDNH